MSTRMAAARCPLVELLSSIPPVYISSPATDRRRDARRRTLSLAGPYTPVTMDTLAVIKASPYHNRRAGALSPPSLHSRSLLVPPVLSTLPFCYNLLHLLHLLWTLSAVTSCIDIHTYIHMFFFMYV